MFTLCKELKFPHPDYLLPYLTAEQLSDWRKYDKGPRTDDPATWEEDEILEFMNRGKPGKARPANHH